MKVAKATCTTLLPILVSLKPPGTNVVLIPVLVLLLTCCVDTVVLVLRLIPLPLSMVLVVLSVPAISTLDQLLFHSFHTVPRFNSLTFAAALPVSVVISVKIH